MSNLSLTILSFEVLNILQVAVFSEEPVVIWSKRLWTEPWTFAENLSRCYARFGFAVNSRRCIKGFIFFQKQVVYIIRPMTSVS